MIRTASQTLLLIANNPQLIYLIKRYAEQSGCQVVRAGSAEEAIKLIERDCPRMVLLHLAAWPHDGWPILQDVRSSCAARNIPITIISATPDEGRARAEGATYWLWQPVMYNDFLAPLVAAKLLTQIATPIHQA